MTTNTMTVKTAIIYRPFLGLEVKQDIDTMLYNATDVLTAYNKSSGMKKEMTKYINLQSTQDYMEVLNTQNPA
jgi:hypothetical protein